MALEIEVHLTENQLAEGFLASLSRRHLPEKFFYWFPLSVKAWLDLCDPTNPYKNYSRSYQLVSRHASDIAAYFHEGTVKVVSLGSGQGDKDLLVLQALREKGCKPLYRPVDSSQALLEMALARATKAGFLARGLKADLENPPALEVLAASDSESRLYMVLGNTLGAIDLFRFARLLRGWMRPHDRLLVDAEIFSGHETMAGYDNPTNRRFAFAPLASLGLEEGRDGALVFESCADPRLDGLHLVSKHFMAGRDLNILVGGRWVELKAGEKIAMNASWKYSAEAFLHLVREVGGFDPLREFFSEDGRFLMVFAAPAAT